MKIRSSLAGVGAALVFGLTAQAAEASSIQCPGGGEGGGEQQIEVGQEGGPPCPQPGGTSSFTATGQSGTGDAYTAEVTLEGPDEMLQPGEVVEIEIDLDDVMASLRSNEEHALALASAFGVRPSEAGAKSGVANASNAFGASVGKLTEAEVEAVAKYVYVSLQSGRATGRSDPATSTWNSRLQAGVQAFERAMSAIGRMIPDVRIRGRETIRDGNNVVRRETSIEVDIQS